MSRLRSGLALTFDDVLLVPRHASVHPRDVSVTSRFTRGISLNVPLVSAAMDTVTEADMAIAMALQGGIGIVHKNLEPELQRTNVKKVKYYLNGFLAKARTMGPRDTIADVNRIKAEKGWRFHSFPIVDEGRRLLGIVTSREFK